MKLARTIVAMVFFGLAGIAQANVAISGNVMTTNPPCSQSAASSGSTVSINLACSVGGATATFFGGGDLTFGNFGGSAGSGGPSQGASFDANLMLSQDYLFTGPSGLAIFHIDALADLANHGFVDFTLFFDGQTFEDGSPSANTYFFNLTQGQTYYLQLSALVTSDGVTNDDGASAFIHYAIDPGLIPVPGIPEPSSFALLATGLLAAAKLVRNRHAILP